MLVAHSSASSGFEQQLIRCRASPGRRRPPPTAAVRGRGQSPGAVAGERRKWELMPAMPHTRLRSNLSHFTLWRYEDQKRVAALGDWGSQISGPARSDRVSFDCSSPGPARTDPTSASASSHHSTAASPPAGRPPCRLGASAASAPPTPHRPQSSGTSRADLPRPPLAAPPVAARARRRARGRRGSRPSGLRRTTPSPCSATRSRGRTPWKPSRPCCGCRPSPDADPRPDDPMVQIILKKLLR